MAHARPGSKPPTVHLSYPNRAILSPPWQLALGSAPTRSAQPSPRTGLLQPGQQLTIPNLLGEPPYPSAALPDSAVIYSPAAAGFQIDDYIAQAGGYLSTYR